MKLGLTRSHPCWFRPPRVRPLRLRGERRGAGVALDLCRTALARGRKDPEETRIDFLRRSLPFRFGTRAGEEDGKSADARVPRHSERKGGA
jgi:hypothetical protein